MGYLRDCAMSQSSKHHILYALLVSFSILLTVEFIGHAAYFIIHNNTTLWKNRTLSSSAVQFTPYGLLEYRPNTTAYMVGYPANLETDRYGFISNGNDEAIQDSDYLVFLIGGSTAEGRGASSGSTTIAAYLDHLLNDIHEEGLQDSDTLTRIRIVNAGFSGHMSYQEKSVVEGKILQAFNPHMIIAFDGRNDAHYAIAYADHGWKPNWQPYYDHLSADINRVIGKVGFFRPLSVLLYRYSIIASSFRKLIGFTSQEQKFPQNEEVPEDLIRKASKYYIDNHVLIQKRCELENVQYFAFLQPTLVRSQKPEMTEREEQLMDRWSKRFNNPEIYYPAVDRFYRHTSSRIGSYRWFFDMSGVFEDNTATIYYDSVHYTDEGNRLIAREIAWVISAAIQERLSE